MGGFRDDSSHLPGCNTLVLHFGTMKHATSLTCIRLSPRQLQILDAMADFRGADNRSDYIRDLIQHDYRQAMDYGMWPVEDDPT